jgi:hypothetical protein
MTHPPNHGGATVLPTTNARHPGPPLPDLHQRQTQLVSNVPIGHAHRPDAGPRTVPDRCWENVVFLLCCLLALRSHRVVLDGAKGDDGCLQQIEPLQHPDSTVIRAGRKV